MKTETSSHGQQTTHQDAGRWARADHATHERPERIRSFCAGPPEGPRAIPGRPKTPAPQPRWMQRLCPIHFKHSASAVYCSCFPISFSF
eukprot:3496975-Pyramimonas_sp.AAC.1